jgi:opacity protein-like surface antigen
MKKILMLAVAALLFTTGAHAQVQVGAGGQVNIGAGGSGFTAGGDLASNSPTSQKVIGIYNVPLCTGFTPTAGQTVIYSTTSSPNPCWAPSGGINLYVNGVLVATALNGVSVNGS